MTLSSTEENYLKAIFKIAEREQRSVSTTAVANRLDTTPASVTDMMKRLSDKGLVNYVPYKGVTLSPQGNKTATTLIRKHRLWEVFLVKKLKFNWDEVHEIAEQLEHINSEELIARLDNFLDYPKFDPHGDPIPNAQGKFTIRTQIPLSDLGIGQSGVLIGVKDNSDDFLQYLNSLSIGLSSRFEVQERIAYDQSLRVMLDNGNSHILGSTVCQNLLIKRV